MLNEVALNACLYDLDDAGITPPTPQAARAILEKDSGFVADLNQYYTKSGNYGLDTADRDIMFDLIAKHFTSQHWPLNMDGEEASKQFRLKLIDGLLAEGWSYKFRAEDPDDK